MSARRPDDIDAELVQRYRNASITGPSAPSDAVRAAILAESRRVAAQNAAHSAGGTPVRARRWSCALFGTLSAAVLAAFLIVPRFAPVMDRPQPTTAATPAAATARRSGASPESTMAPEQATAPQPATAPQTAMAAKSVATPYSGPARDSTTARQSGARAERAERALDSDESRLTADAPAPTAGIRAKAGGESLRSSRSVQAAVKVGDLGTVKSLLDKGAAVDETDDQGATPLMLATALGRADIVRLLLEHGADPNATDRSGQTALQEAQRRQFKEIETLLTRAGAH
jgi:hypothetical protein